MKLRPLLVVTGTVHVEGGEQNTLETLTEPAARGRERMVITQEREITRDRRRANVIATGYMRRLRKMQLSRTPFGHLVDPARRDELQVMINAATKDVREFNGTARNGCRLANCMVWEILRGNRRAALEGWFTRQVRDGFASDKEAESLRAPVPQEDR
jgi:hypothetical protein